MTISIVNNREQYNGDDSTVEFPYNFLVLDRTHLLVWVDLVLTTDWDIDGLGNASGGKVTFNTAPPTGEGNVTFLRQVPLQQLTDYEEYDPFPAETHEGALDYLTMICQQQQEEIDRSVKFSTLQETPEDFTALFGDAAERVNKIWSFDETGQFVILIDPAEEKAYRWAETPEDEVVENRGGQNRYSAFHWSQKAFNTVNPPMTTKADLYGQSDSGPTRVPAERVDVAGDPTGPAQDGDFLVVNGLTDSGLAYAAPSGQLPGLQAGDQLKILQVNLAETGYELTGQYTDTVYHAAEMLEDDESDGAKSIEKVPHYSNISANFFNPPAAGTVGWFNDVIVRRHDALNYRLRLRITNPIGDTSVGTVYFQADIYTHIQGLRLDRAPDNTVLSAASPLLGDEGLATDVIFPGLLPMAGAVPDVLASIKITRIQSSQTHTGDVAFIAAILEIE